MSKFLFCFRGITDPTTSIDYNKNIEITVSPIKKDEYADITIEYEDYLNNSLEKRTLTHGILNLNYTDPEILHFWEAYPSWYYFRIHKNEGENWKLYLNFRNPIDPGLDPNPSINEFEFLDHPLKSEFVGKENASKYLKEINSEGPFYWEIESIKIIDVE
jgi:hypothetical protein